MTTSPSFACLGVDPQTLSPGWTVEHSRIAQAEGWDIFETSGSEGGRWQIQSLDEPLADAGATQLLNDEQAWTLVVNGTGAHHEAARLFVQAHNGLEWAAISKFCSGEASGHVTQSP